MSRFAFHLSWNQRSKKDMLLYRALRELPHGFSKQVIIRMIDAVVGECEDPKQIANVLFHFANAKDELARSVIVGGAPLEWRSKGYATDAEAVRDMREATRTVRANDFVRAAHADAPPGFTYALIPADGEEEAEQPGGYPQPPPAQPYPHHREGGVIVPPAPPPSVPPAPKQDTPAPRKEAAHPDHMPSRAPSQASLGLMP